MAITQEAPNSQTMRALLALRELILSGEFGHGDRMSELPLVERLGVSRTPVRLALAALEHEGLLRALPSSTPRSSIASTISARVNSRTT